MYEKFLSQNMECERQVADGAFIAKYVDIAPKELITLWQEVGLGIFCNGLFRIMNPADYQEFVNQYYQREYNEAAIPFMVTAFGDLFVYIKSSQKQLGNHIVFLNIRYGTFQIFTDNFNLLFNILLFKNDSLEFRYKLGLYPRIKEKLGALQGDECFGYVPVLSAGGEETDEHIQVVKIFPYIDMAAQFIGEFERFEAR
ncbi:T6SS immunity protein Tdi1 domain-containing protein [Bacteroides ovatus]|uniref:T6SS immunity protein Tdi1 domain-containing protein n=1 Tax=Bacteroides ovatus TaxID=28116 RepID=UPI002166A56E|nr:T6SS immunity protein Tdi1 domain-containing protein [Bacteroides ovatus]MCS2298417.1 DUF1851 domain-containing protein [Bacteroides ovatus]